MFPRNQMNMGQGGMPAAFRPLATILSIGATALLAPQIWPWIERPIGNAIFDLYDHGYAVWLVMAAKFGVWPFSFFVLRLGFMGAFMWLSLVAARRLM